MQHKTSDWVDFDGHPRGSLSLCLHVVYLSWLFFTQNASVCLHCSSSDSVRAPVVQLIRQRGSSATLRPPVVTSDSNWTNLEAWTSSSITCCLNVVAQSVTTSSLLLRVNDSLTQLHILLFLQRVSSLETVLTCQEAAQAQLFASQVFSRCTSTWIETVIGIEDEEFASFEWRSVLSVFVFQGSDRP